MTAVQGAYPDGEHDVEGCFTWQKGEVLRGGLANTHATRGDLAGSTRSRLGNRLRGPVDGEYVARDEAGSHRPCRRARTTADFQDAGVRT